MNKVFSLVAGFCMLFLASANAQVVYFEDFEDDADNNLAAGTAVGGTWSTTYAGGGDVWSQEAGVLFVGDVFLAENIQSEGVWSTNAVTINTSYVSLDLEGSTAFTEAGDYMRAYYRINGGAEILFFDKATSTAFSLDVVGQTAIISITPGQTIQIVVRMFNNANNDYFALDDVSISEIRTLYSRANTNWNAAGTWSTVGLGGVSCACTPDDFTRQVIGGNTVQFTANANTTDLEIRTGGELDWDGNFDLNVIKQGTITVDNGGTIDRDGFADAQIDYDEAFPFSIVNNGTFTIGDIDVNAATTLTISGTSAITVASDFLIGATATVTNNLSATLAVTGTLHFEAGAGDFNNNGVMTAGALLFNSDNCAVTNTSSLTIAGNISANGNGDDGNQVTNSAGATLSFVNLDGDAAAATGDGGDLTIQNSGTINQTGTFLDIPANTNAANDINNLDGATWNYSGTGHDTNLRLQANTGTNTFHYNLGGAQQVITPVTGNAYSNLRMSNSGTKIQVGSIDVNGDISVENSVLFNCNNFNITLGGNFSLISTASFSEGAGNFTLDGTADQTISNVSGSETFNNLIVNKASGIGVLSSSPATSITINSVLTLTNGGLSLNGQSLTLLNGATGAIARTNGYIISETTGTPYGRVIWRMGLTTGSHVFHFGTAAGSYIPFTFNYTIAGVGATGTVTVSTYPTPNDNTPYPNTVTHMFDVNGVDNTANVVNRFWIVTTAGYTTQPTAQQTFVWQASESQGSTPRAAQRWDGTDTWLAGVGSSATTTLTPPAALVATSSIWAVASTSAPLPIVLSYFNAKIEGENVVTEWKTLQEIDNDFFTIQKTADLETFYDVEKIPGQGNSRENHVYSSIDRSPFAGRSYYRLKQTDFDGKYSYSDLVTVDYDGPSSASVHAYPNPFDGKQITIELKGVQKSETIPVQIYNQQGIKVFDLILSADGPGTIQQEVNFNTTLPQGLYIIRAGKTLQLTRKIVVN